MSENTETKQVLSTGQVTFLFLIFISTLFLIFAAGVFIGRWSRPTGERKVESLKIANIRFVEANVIAGQQDSTQSVYQSVPETPPASPADDLKAKTRYAVQVATLSTVEEANGLLTQLRRDGLTKSYVRAPEPGSVVQLYSVEVGQYEDKASADQIVIQLRAKGLNKSHTTQIYSFRKDNTVID